MALTIGQAVTAVHDAFVGLTVGGDPFYLQDYDELKEGIHDLPTIQFYPETLEVDSRTETDTHTLNKSVRVHRLVVRMDVYADRRNHLDENMERLVDVWDAVEDELETEAGCPAFGVETIRSVHWTCERVIFDYTNTSPATEYAGIRYELELEIF